MAAAYESKSRHVLKRNVESELEEPAGFIPAGLRVYPARSWLTIINVNQDGTYNVLFDKDKGASPDTLLMYTVHHDLLEHWLTEDK